MIRLAQVLRPEVVAAVAVVIAVAVAGRVISGFFSSGGNDAVCCSLDLSSSCSIIERSAYLFETIGLAIGLLTETGFTEIGLDLTLVAPLSI